MLVVVYLKQFCNISKQSYLSIIVFSRILQKFFKMHNQTLLSSTPQQNVAMGICPTTKTSLIDIKTNSGMMLKKSPRIFVASSSFAKLSFYVGFPLCFFHRSFCGTFECILVCSKLIQGVCYHIHLILRVSNILYYIILVLLLAIDTKSYMRPSYVSLLNKAKFNP